MAKKVIKPFNWSKIKRDVAAGFHGESRINFLRRLFNAPLYVGVPENKRYHYTPPALAEANIKRAVPSTDV